jgi:hypothetical protein
MRAVAGFAEGNYFCPAEEFVGRRDIHLIVAVGQ